MNITRPTVKRGEVWATLNGAVLVLNSVHHTATVYRLKAIPHHMQRPRWLDDGEYYYDGVVIESMPTYEFNEKLFDATPADVRVATTAAAAWCLGRSNKRKEIKKEIKKTEEEFDIELVFGPEGLESK